MHPAAPIDKSANDLGTALKRARKAAGFSNAHAFLDAMKAAVGTAPSYSTYAQWESGEVNPRDESLAPVRAFHEARGTWVETQAGPDLATALMALAGELRALREERAQLVARVDELESRLGAMPEPGQHQVPNDFWVRLQSLVETTQPPHTSRQATSTG